MTTSLSDNGLQFSDGTTMPSAYSLGLRNRIINGGCDVSQRFGVSAQSLPANTLTLSVDRIWVALNGSGTGGFVQALGLAGYTSYSSNGVQITGGAGTTNPQFLQRIEAANSRDMAGKQVTFSAYVFQNSGASLSVSASISRYTTLDVSGTATLDTTLTCTPAVIPSGVVTRVVAIGTLTTSAILGINAGMIFSGAFGAGAACNITGIQLELGSVATPFEQHPYGLELALCQRYYQAFTMLVSAQTGIYTPVKHLTTMRITPTALTQTAGSGGVITASSADYSALSFTSSSANYNNAITLSAEL